MCTTTEPSRELRSSELDDVNGAGLTHIIIPLPPPGPPVHLGFGPGAH